jgi:hypothetical protein
VRAVAPTRFMLWSLARVVSEMCGTRTPCSSMLTGVTVRNRDFWLVTLELNLGYDVPALRQAGRNSSPAGVW